MGRFDRLAPNDTKMRRENMNAVMDWVELLSNLRTGYGLTLSNGPAGMAISMDENVVPRIAIGKASVSSGSYPSTFDNDRKVFPARIVAGPGFDASSPTTAHTESLLEAPAINVYNLAKCWILENDYFLMAQLNGYWWCHHRVYVRGIAAADITKGSTGNITVGSLTFVARAYYGDTVNGKKVGLEHNGTEWTIAEEEC